MNNSFRWLLAGWGLWSASASAMADAQLPVLADVEVTARKRLEPSAAVAISMQVMQGEAVRANDVRDWYALADAVPGLRVSPSLRGTPVVTLRGIGFNNPALSATSPVAVYMDEGGYPHPMMNAGPMLDIERVEVLKGPQGTLFGRNATGGLINYVTVHPGTESTGYLQVDTGSYQRHGVQAAATVPVDEALAVRLAGSVHRTGEGWQHCQCGPQQLGRERTEAARAAVRWQPSAGSELLAVANWWHDGSDTQAPQSVARYPQGLLAAGIDAAQAQAIGVPAAFFEQSFVPANARQADWVQHPLSWGGSTFQSPPLTLRKDNVFHSLLMRLDQVVGHGVTLTALGHYAGLQRREVNDMTGWTIENALLRSRGEARTFSQELRLAGDAEPLSWQVGIFHGRDQVQDVDDAWAGSSSSLQLVRAQASALLASSGADQAQQLEAFYGMRAARNHVDQRADNLAVFGEVDLSLTSQLSLTAGLRINRSNTRFAGCSADMGDGNLAATLNPFYHALGIPAAIDAGGCATFLGELAPALLSGGEVAYPAQGRVTDQLREAGVDGRLALRWLRAPGQMLYLSLAQGSKPGAFPNIEANLASQYAPARQERLRAIEGGAKWRWGDWLSVAPSVFRYQYRDQQVFGAVEDILFNTLSRIVNVPRSHAYGADLQATAVLPDAWRVALAATWLHTQVDRYAGYDEFGEWRSFAGARFPYAPTLEWVATVSKGMRLSGALVGELALTYRHAQHSWADMTGDERFRIRGQDQLDLHMIVSVPRQQLSMQLRVENITDQYRWTNAYLVNDSLTRYAARPRQWSLWLVQEW